MQNYKKRLGQHFLHDNNIIKKIIMSVQPKENDHFLEIGPGEGALTNPMLDIIENITLIEKDKDLIPFLKNQYHQYNKVKILHADILKCHLADYMSHGIRVIGNLPYNISTEIIFKMVSVSSKVQDMHFMLQKEVVDRIVAGPGSKTYGRLSVMAQVYFNTTKLFDISPNVFTPKPKVQSSYIRMIPKSSVFTNNIYENNFRKLVTKVFTARRKMIKTSLKDHINESVLKNLSINPSSRPEVLTIADFLEIAKYVQN